ncbi:MAG: hypothetical protein HQ582_28865 [Planctomycetes bacterium]|nr:hypothetical protein [Planctomycetota bacterium]
MPETSHDELMVASFWMTSVQSAQSHANGAARRSGGPFGELIVKEAAAFCEQQSPKTHDELSTRNLQSMALTGKISSISHAASAAQRHPNVADIILGETKTFCDRVSLNDDVALESLAFTQKISNICFSDRAL